MRAIKLAANRLERDHDAGIHRRAGNIREKLRLEAAGLLAADLGKAVLDPPHDPVQDAGLQVADFHGQLGQAWDDVDRTRLESHHPHVGDAVVVDRLDQALEVRGEARRGATRVLVAC